MSDNTDPAETVTPRNAKRLLAVVEGEATSAFKDLTIGKDEVFTWPHLLYRELLAAMWILVGLWLVSIVFDAPLEEVANPTHSPNPAKAPWYFLGLQELLVYFDPWIAGVVVPGLIIVGLTLIPYLDPGTRTIGEYDFSKRTFALFVFTVGLVMWFGLILIGVYFRGPNWGWYFPWESWGLEREFQPTFDLPVYFGLPLILLYFGVGLYLPRLRGWRLTDRLTRHSYYVIMTFVLLMLGVLLKIALRLLFSIKYVLVTPWFNI